MNLVATDTGRVLQLLVPDEVRPLHGYDLPTIFKDVAERYGFLKTPGALDGFANPTGARFEAGRFPDRNGSGNIPIMELSLFNDGVIATCADTDLADLLIEDLLEWLIERGAMRRPVAVKPRTHTSNIVVQFNQEAAHALDTALGIASRLRASLSDQREADWDTALERLSFTAESRASGSSKVTLVLERRRNTLRDQNYFWSSAPLRINAHTALLSSIEEHLQGLC